MGKRRFDRTNLGLLGNLDRERSIVKIMGLDAGSVSVKAAVLDAGGHRPAPAVPQARRASRPLALDMLARRGRHRAGLRHRRHRLRRQAHRADPRHRGGQRDRRSGLCHREAPSARPHHHRDRRRGLQAHPPRTTDGDARTSP